MWQESLLFYPVSYCIQREIGWQKIIPEHMLRWEFNLRFGYSPVSHSSISRIDFLGINFLGFEFLETWMKSRDSFLGMKFLRLELHMSIKSQFFMATYAINFLTILQPRCVEMHFMYNFKTTLKIKYWVPPHNFGFFLKASPFSQANIQLT